MAGKVLGEQPGTEGYLQVGKGPVVLAGRGGYWLVGTEPAGRGRLKTEGIGVDKEEGQVADTVDYRLAGIEHLEFAGRDWGQDKH